MLRRAALLVLIAAGLSSAAQAQDAPLKVLYRPTHTFAMDDLNAAIVAALSKPPFRMMTAPAPDVLIVAIPDQVEVSHKQVSGTSYAFKMTFRRNGDPVGEADEGCNAAKLSDCIDQIVMDVKTAGARP
jgi:hypothetical protein